MLSQQALPSGAPQPHVGLWLCFLVLGPAGTPLCPSGLGTSCAACSNAGGARGPGCPPLHRVSHFDGPWSEVFGTPLGLCASRGVLAQHPQMPRPWHPSPQVLLASAGLPLSRVAGRSPCHAHPVSQGPQRGRCSRVTRCAETRVWTWCRGLCVLASRVRPYPQPHGQGFVGFRIQAAAAAFDSPQSPGHTGRRPLGALCIVHPTRALVRL